jgi:hypothetical protein
VLQLLVLLLLGVAVAVAVVQSQMGQHALLTFSNACLAHEHCHGPCTSLPPVAVSTLMAVRHMQAQRQQQRQQQEDRQALMRSGTGSWRPRAHRKAQLLQPMLLLRQRRQQLLLHRRPQESWVPLGNSRLSSYVSGLRVTPTGALLLPVRQVLLWGQVV